MSVHEPGLVGVWDLVSIRGESDDGRVNVPFGEHPVGRLSYTADGHMSALLMKPDRSQFAGGDIAGGTQEQVAEAFRGFDAYTGHYTVDAEAGTVTHHVIGARVPNWVGSDQVRHFELDGDVLKIVSDPITAGGAAWTVRVLWKRADPFNG